MTNDNYSAAEGWLVEVVMPLPGGRQRQQFYGASFVDPCEAIAAVSERLGALHAKTRPVCRLSTRALGRAGIKSLEVAPIGTAVVSRPRPGRFPHSLVNEQAQRGLRLVHPSI
jgi:hypothetical protein